MTKSLSKRFILDFLIRPINLYGNDKWIIFEKMLLMCFFDKVTFEKIYSWLGSFLNPNGPGHFCKNSKVRIENFKKLISSQLRVPQKRTIARLKGLVLGFHFGQVSPCRRAHRCAGACSNTEYNWELLRKNLFCKCRGLVFAMCQDFF